MNRLKELRVARGLKQTELATLLNISQGALSGWETGRYSIGNEDLKKLSDFFNVSIDYILNENTKFDLQLFSNDQNFKVAQFAGEILAMKDDKKITLTLELLEKVKTMSVEQIEALNVLLKK
jgi:transcriptional regulator with XRE-family HTH domain